MIINDAMQFGLSPSSDTVKQMSAAANRIYRSETMPCWDSSIKTAYQQPFCAVDHQYYFMPPTANAKIDGTGRKAAAYPVEAIRADFPILSRSVNGRPLVWLDNAATTQKPKSVMDTLTRYYSQNNSNVHRGAHQLAREATDAYESARQKVRRFIGAGSAEEIVFVRGTTEAINLAAASWGGGHIRAGDEIILSEMEHHSNIVPWQMLARRTGAVIRVIPVDEIGQIMMGEYERLFSPRTRIAAVTHVSNVLGTVNPVRQMADIAHANGALFLVDGAQSAAHLPVNVTQADADFFAFSGHKVYGPTGIGALYAKKGLLSMMQPYQGGGGIIESVSFANTTYKDAPEKFEAGTVNIADAVGLGAAIDYMQNIGMDNIMQYESRLTGYLMERLQKINGVRLVGTAPGKAGVVALTAGSTSPDRLAKYLDGRGIAIRAGHHCAQPILTRFGLKSAARASIGMYNTFDEMDALADAVSTYQGHGGV